MTDTELKPGTRVVFVLRGQERQGRIEAAREAGFAVSFIKPRTSARSSAGRGTVVVPLTSIVKAV